MPNPSTVADEVDPSPARRPRDALLAFASGSISMFFLAALLVLAVVGLIAGLFMLLLWSVVPH